MGQWSRQEIESAFDHHKQVVVEIGQSWDWSRFADEFTEDAVYVEHSFGTSTAGKRSGSGSWPR